MQKMLHKLIQPLCPNDSANSLLTSWSKSAFSADKYQQIIGQFLPQMRQFIHSFRQRWGGIDVTGLLYSWMLDCTQGLRANIGWVLLYIAVLRHSVLLCPAPNRRGIKRWCCLTSDCLAVVYIGPTSRTERPKKTTIGTEVAHVTCDSDTTFKVKRSKVNLQDAGAYCGGLPHSLFTMLWYDALYCITFPQIYAYKMC